MKRIVLILALVVGGATISPVAPAAHDETLAGQTPVAILVNGRGFGHGRGMSQYGSLGWATKFGKTWQEILDFYYGGTTLSQLTETDAGLSPGGKIAVRLTTLDGRQTAVLSDNSSLTLVNDPVPGRKWAALVAREIAGTTAQYRVWGSTVAKCPVAAKTPEESGFVQVADVATTSIRDNTQRRRHSGSRTERHGRRVRTGRQRALLPLCRRSGERNRRREPDGQHASCR